MKKIIAFVLSVVMVMSMSVTAFAADLELSYDGATGQSTISYTEQSYYVVIIPEVIYLDNPYQFTAIHMNIKDTEEVVIRFTNLDDNDMMTLTNADGETVSLAITGLRDDYDTCAAFRDDELISSFSISAHTVSTTGDIDAGEYTGTAEFIVSLSTPG